MERTKDPMVKFRSVIRGKNSKGGDRSQLYLDTENATTLIQVLTDNLTNPKGVKIDLHISRKTAADSGREFDSAICFVKPTADAPGGTRNQVATPSVNNVEAQIQAMKARQIRTT